MLILVAIGKCDSIAVLSMFLIGRKNDLKENVDKLSLSEIKDRFRLNLTLSVMNSNQLSLLLLSTIYSK